MVGCNLNILPLMADTALAIVLHMNLILAEV